MSITQVQIQEFIARFTELNEKEKDAAQDLIDQSLRLIFGRFIKEHGAELFQQDIHPASFLYLSHRRFILGTDACKDFQKILKQEEGALIVTVTMDPSGPKMRGMSVWALLVVPTSQTPYLDENGHVVPSVMLSDLPPALSCFDAEGGGFDGVSRLAHWRRGEGDADITADTFREYAHNYSVLLATQDGNIVALGAADYLPVTVDTPPTSCQLQ